MSYSIVLSKKFEKSLKRCKKRGLDISKLKTVIDLLSATGTLPAKYRPHTLSGRFEGVWECHIQPDWLLLWHINDDELVLLILDTGSHADLF